MTRGETMDDRLIGLVSPCRLAHSTAEQWKCCHLMHRQTRRPSAPQQHTRPAESSFGMVFASVVEPERVTRGGAWLPFCARVGLARGSCRAARVTDAKLWVSVPFSSPLPPFPSACGGMGFPVSGGRLCAQHKP